MIRFLEPQAEKVWWKEKISRILSPGITYDPSFLDELKSHYLCAFDQSTVSFADYTTGEAFTYSFSSEEERCRLILLIQPVEIIFDDQQKKATILFFGKYTFFLFTKIYLLQKHLKASAGWNPIFNLWVEKKL